jgi:4,5-DOPA dioxygenase extradiol
MIALEPGAAGAFMRELGPALDAAFTRPQAIVVVSAHSLTREPVLLAAERHDTVHDFGGFPQPLYELRYDAVGAPALAPRAAQLVRDAGLPVQVMAEGGLDHGMWMPLRFAYPNVDVPVLPLAFPANWSPRQLFALGQSLAPLRSEGVLVLGSGSITHNLRLVFSRNAHADTAREDQPEMPESARLGAGSPSQRSSGPRSAVRLPQARTTRRLHAPERRAPVAVVCGRGRRPRRPVPRVHDSVTRAAWHGRLRVRCVGRTPGARTARHSGGVTGPLKSASRRQVTRHQVFVVGLECPSDGG